MSPAAFMTWALLCVYLRRRLLDVLRSCKGEKVTFCSSPRRGEGVPDGRSRWRVPSSASVVIVNFVLSLVINSGARCILRWALAATASDGRLSAAGRCCGALLRGAAARSGVALGRPLHPIPCQSLVWFRWIPPPCINYTCWLKSPLLAPPPLPACSARRGCLRLGAAGAPPLLHVCPSATTRRPPRAARQRFCRLEINKHGGIVSQGGDPFLPPSLSYSLFLSPSSSPGMSPVAAPHPPYRRGRHGAP